MCPMGPGFDCDSGMPGVFSSLDGAPWGKWEVHEDV